jgi:hypothetical protein
VPASLLLQHEIDYKNIISAKIYLFRRAPDKTLFYPPKYCIDFSMKQLCMGVD